MVNGDQDLTTLLLVCEERRTYEAGEKIDGHRDLVVWNEAMTLVCLIYKITNGYPKSETYGLTDQSRRAAVSIPANIAEGSGRRTTADLIHFLTIASASLRELDTLVEVAVRVGYLESSNAFCEQAGLVGKMLTNLMKSLRSKPPIK